MLVGKPKPVKGRRSSRIGFKPETLVVGTSITVPQSKKQNVLLMLAKKFLVGRFSANQTAFCARTA